MKKIRLIFCSSYRRKHQRDLAATTAYIFSELMKSPLFFSNIDKATDIATAFIEKFPTGTNWERFESFWSEKLYSFYNEYLEEEKKKRFDDIKD